MELIPIVFIKIFEKADGIINSSTANIALIIMNAVSNEVDLKKTHAVLVARKVKNQKNMS